MRRRVVVTGLGAVTPLGNDVPTMWEGLLTGRSGIGRISSFDPSELEVQIAAEVKDFDPVALFGRKEARRNDRFALFAMEAARQAIADAGLRFDNGQGVDTGVLIGTGIGGLLTLLDAYDTFLARGA
ncbi:MAG: beta-ketoacyl-[acyl-carrier-protein] synthase II, partial [Chloroflexi bacterium]|nr:beta-ketoacyl-[acyl-carrier-protein] synthase II [Chloroflexota bacterium]